MAFYHRRIAIAYIKAIQIQDLNPGNIVLKVANHKK